MEQPQQMPRPDFGACKATSPSSSGEVRTPSENDLLVTRLVARIAELEERLYKKELEAPAIGPRIPPASLNDSSAGSGAAAYQQQHQQDQVLQTPIASVVPAAPRLRDSFLATLRESWAKLELHAAGGSNASAAPPAAVAPPTAAAGAVPPMRSLDAVATPRRTAMPAGVAASEVPSVARAGNVAGGDSADGDVQSPDRALSAENSQAGSFAFSTHLVVDYSKPTRGSPMTPGRRRRGKEASPGSEYDDGAGTGGNSGPDNSDGDGDDDDGGSMSSIGSSGMGYDTSVEEQELQRRRSSMTGGPAPKPSVGRSALSMPSTPQGRAGGSGGGGAAAVESGSRKPPLPPSRPVTAGRSGSEGGAAMALPSPCGQQQQQPQLPSHPPQPVGGAASRAAGWSGSMLSKLGLAWGRDRGGGGGDARDSGNSMTRNGSAGSLVQPFPSFRQSFMGPGPVAGTPEASFSDRALEEQLAAGDAAGGGRYYRYVFDPADLQAEMEVTARVRRAAAEALMEANSKLAEAQAAAAALQRQVEQSKELELELEALRAERAAAQSAKAALEDDMAGVRRQLAAMKETEASLQAELEGVRSQADIWSSSSGGEAEKLKQENALLRSQLTNRLSELQSCRARLSDGEAERQRLKRDGEELRNKIQWLTKINLQLETAASQLNDARRAASEWQERFMRERNVRRRLHDQLQQLRGNIRVVCRVRPVQVGQRDMVSYPLEGLLAVSCPTDKKYQEYEFDHVFPPSAAQGEVFAEAVAPLVRSVAAEGLSACVLAYGQPGSGKTFTMLGSQEDPGICVRALRELFRIAAEESMASARSGGPTARASASAARDSSGGAAVEDQQASAAPASEAEDGGTAATPASASNLGRYNLHVAMYEVCNEAVYDLLAPGQDGADGGSRPPLEVSILGPDELPRGAERLPGLTWHPLGSPEAADALLGEGARRRTAAGAATTTTSVAASASGGSRSHLVVSVRVDEAAGPGPSPGSSSGGSERKGAVRVLHLVDLAGPDRADKADAAGQQPKQEAQSVSRSLAALGDVISALQRRSPSVPFRSSKLTAVLQDALYGSSKILLLCNIAPEATSAAETISALNFASRAAQVELGVVTRAPPAVGERVDRGPMSPGASDRALLSGGGGSSSGGGGGVGCSRGGLSSPLHSHPPLPIMNGTAAKVRAAAAAAAAAAAIAAAAGSGTGAATGGGAGLRASQRFAGSNSDGGTSGGGASGNSSGGGSSSGGGGECSTGGA